MRNKNLIDPEERRYRIKYPKFPGVAECVSLLHSPNVQGAYLNMVCFDLETHVNETLDQMIAAFQSETDERVKTLLIAAIAEASPAKALSFFIENLNSTNKSIQDWAESGLQKIDSKEARTALWQAGKKPDKSKREEDSITSPNPLTD